MIYQTYGHQSVTIIINAMRRDRRTGGHPNLRETIDYLLVQEYSSSIGFLSLVRK